MSNLASPRFPALTPEKKESGSFASPPVSLSVHPNRSFLTTEMRRAIDTVRPSTAGRLVRPKQNPSFDIDSVSMRATLKTRTKFASGDFSQPPPTAPATVASLAAGSAAIASLLSTSRARPSDSESVRSESTAGIIFETSIGTMTDLSLTQIHKKDWEDGVERTVIPKMLRNSTLMGDILHESADKSVDFKLKLVAAFAAKLGITAEMHASSFKSKKLSPRNGQNSARGLASGAGGGSTAGPNLMGMSSSLVALLEDKNDIPIVRTVMSQVALHINADGWTVFDAPENASAGLDDPVGYFSIKHADEKYDLKSSAGVKFEFGPERSGITHLGMNSRRPVVVKKAKTHPNYNALMDRCADSIIVAGTFSLSGRSSGAAQFLKFGPHNVFSADDCLAVQTAATFLSILNSCVHQQEEVEQVRIAVATLSEAVKGFSGFFFSLESCLSTYLRMCVASAKASSGVIWILDPKDTALIPFIIDDKGTCRVAREEETFNPNQRGGTGAVQLCINTQTAVNLHNVSFHTPVSRTSTQKHHTFVSMVCVPWSDSSGEAVGAVQLLNRQPTLATPPHERHLQKPFTALDWQLIPTIGFLAAENLKKTEGYLKLSRGEHPLQIGLGPTVSSSIQTAEFDLDDAASRNSDTYADVGRDSPPLKIIPPSFSPQPVVISTQTRSYSPEPPPHPPTDTREAPPVVRVSARRPHPSPRPSSLPSPRPG